MSDRFQIIPAADHLRAHVRGMDFFDSLEQVEGLGPGVAAALLVARDEQPDEVGTDGDIRKISKVRLQRPRFTPFPAESLIDSQEIEPLAAARHQAGWQGTGVYWEEPDLIPRVS